MCKQSGLIYIDHVNSKYSRHSKLHWSPTNVIRQACLYLQDSENVLDVGSGIGSFVIEASKQLTANLTGVEIRENLHNEALRLNEKHKGKGRFLNSDISEVDFSPFDGVYYYNPFCEHLAESGAIDDQLQKSDQLFTSYTDLIACKLLELQIGATLVCHNTDTYFIPDLFELLHIDDDHQLTVWKRIR